MEFFDSKKVEKAHNVIDTITQSSGNDLIRRADALKAFDDNIVWGAPRLAIMEIPAVKQPISAEEYEALQNALNALKTNEKLHFLQLNRKERELYTQAIMAAKSAISALYHRKLEESEGSEE